MKLFDVIELIELVPQDQARLLKKVVGVVQVPHERVDVAEQLRLMMTNQGREISPGIIRCRHRVRLCNRGRSLDTRLTAHRKDLIP